MKKIKEFNIEDYSYFSKLIDLIYQSHVDAGGNLSKAGLRENLSRILNSWGSSDEDFILFLALYFYRGDPYSFKKVKESQTYLFENEYRGYTSLFGALCLIETAGVKGDLEDLWWGLGYHVRVFKDEGFQPPIDVQMFFQDDKINTLQQTCTTREDLVNQVRHFETYPAIKLFYVNYPDLALSLDFSTIVFIHELDLISSSAK